MACRESFYTKPEARFYKETYKESKNLREFKSQVNPLQHEKDNSASTGFNKKKLLYDQKSNNNIFGEQTNTKPNWLGAGGSRQLNNRTSNLHRE